MDRARDLSRGPPSGWGTPKPEHGNRCNLGDDGAYRRDALDAERSSYEKEHHEPADEPDPSAKRTTHVRNWVVCYMCYG